MNSNLKDKLKSGKVVHGCWVNLGSTVSAEIIGQTGFDWVLVDLEHGPSDNFTMYQQLQVLSGTNTAAIVRTDELSRPKVRRLLDAGAYGIMFPQIQNKEEATLASKSMYYPPKGIRGLSRRVRASGFGKTFDHYFSSLDKILVCVIQIESIAGVENIESIAQLNDVDVLFLGPNDLTLAMGIPGQYNHPEYQKAMKRIAEVAKKYGKVAGVLLQNISEYEMYHSSGYRFIASGADASFVADGASEMLRRMNEGTKK
jgi:4-hydroxy-2-oxoheptanedioate aldolase